MPKRTGQSRVYWRAGHAYGDFRDFAAEGGKREPLVAEGERFATSDASVAERLTAERLLALESIRKERKLYGPNKGARLKEYAAEHLVAKAKSGKVTEDWLQASQLFLSRAVDHFGAGRDLSAIRVQDVREWTERLAEMQTRSGERMTAGTIRHHLNTLSNLFRHAASEGRIPTSYNPVRDLLDKPTARRVEARWLEVPDAALLLESCRTYRPKRPDLCLPYLYPLVATYLLTGGRRREVLGLEVSDVNFERKVVTFRPSAWRRLKSATSHRSVPLVPQLEAILRAYLSERTARQVLGNEPTRALLFPAEGPNGEALVSDFRKVLDGAAIRAGFSEPVIRGGEVVKDKRGRPVLRSTVKTHMLRHTFTAARLQTLDHGAPVSPFTVARELGHGGDTLVKRIYGHLGETRHRAEVVEYRIEQHEERLAERLAAFAR